MTGWPPAGVPNIIVWFLFACGAGAGAPKTMVAFEAGGGADQLICVVTTVKDTQENIDRFNGYLAGFSERFVPEFLNKLEARIGEKQ